MRKISVILIIAIMMATMPNEIVMAKEVMNIGEVKELYDSELMKVKLYGGEYENIRLVGIDTKSSEEAFAFVKNFVQQTPLVIHLFVDDSGNYIRDEYGFILAEVKDVDTSSLNEELLSQGLSYLEKSYTGISEYKLLVDAYNYAFDNGFGMHGDGKDINPYAKKLNINVANTIELSNLLLGLNQSSSSTSSTLSQKIYTYAKYNPINTLNELKFIDPIITNDWIDSNRNKISLVTNINTAEDYELSTLFASSKDEQIADNIIDYRLEHPFTSIDELKKIDGITEKLYNKMYHYVSLKYERSYKSTEDVVNINTANESQLKELDFMSEHLAKRIVKYRYNDKYDYKSKEELLKLPSPFDPVTFNQIEDNISIYTDINTAGKSEVSSLFGKSSLSSTKKALYASRILEKRPFTSIDELKKHMPSSVVKEISPYIYVGNKEYAPKININVAKADLLEDYLDITEKEAEKLAKYTKYHTVNYYQELDQKVDLSDKNQMLTLYTNINTASKEELQLLHSEIKDDLLDNLLKYREEAPFASDVEVSEFFKKYKKTHIYNTFKEYIVFR